MYGNDNDDEEIEDNVCGPETTESSGQPSTSKTGTSAPAPSDPAATLELPRIRLRLCGRFGFKDDEIDTLFKSEAEIRDAYRQALLLSSSSANSQADMEQSDDYKLSTAEDVRLMVDEASRREAKASTKAVKQTANQANFPEHARVDEDTINETQRSIADLDLGDFDEDEEDFED